MATQVGEASVKLKFDAKGAASQLKSDTEKAASAAKKAIEDANKKVSGSISAIKQITTGALRYVGEEIVSAINQNLDGAISRVDTLRNASKMFSAMGYSVGGVNKTMSLLDEYLDGLPTALDEAVDGVQSLSASFGGIDIGTKAFKAINDAGLAFGATSDQIRTAITQLSQTSLDGPLDAQTWNSLRNSGFSPVFTAMAKEAGITVNELKEQFGGNGTKTVRMFMEQLIKLDEEGSGAMQSLAEMARTNTDGIGTALTNLQTRLRRAIANAIEAIGASNISRTINNFSKNLITIGERLGNKIRSLLGDKKIKTLLKQLGEGFKDTFEGMKRAAEGSLKVLYDIFTDGTFGYAVKILGKAIKAVGTAIAEIAKNKTAVALIKSLLTAFLAYKGVDLAANAILGFSAKLPALAKNITAVLKGGSLAPMLSATGTAATGAIGPLSGIATAVGQWALPVAAAVGVGSLLGRSLAEIALQGKAARDGLAGVREAASKLSEANDRLATAQSSVKTAQDDAVASLQTLREAESNAKDVAAGYGLTLNQAKEYVGKLNVASDELTQKDIDLYNAVTTLKTAEGERKTTLDELKNSTNELKDAEKARADALNTAELEALKRSTEAVTQRMLEEGKYSDIIDVLQRLQSEYQMTGKINGQETSLTKDQVHSALDSVASDLSGLSNANATTWKGIWQDAENNIDKLNSSTAPKAGQAGTKIITDLSSGANSKLPSVKTTFNSIGNSGAQSLKNGLSSGKTSAADMILQNAQNANNKSGTLKSSMSSIASSASTSFKNGMSSSSGYNAGASIVNGAISGAQSRSGGLSSTLSSIASSALASFKKLLKIESPSKVMAEQGAYIVEGLALGIEKTKSRANAAMSAIADGVVTSTDIDLVTPSASNLPQLGAIAHGTVDLRDGGNRVDTGGVTIYNTFKVNNALDADDIGRRINNSIRLATL